MTIPPGTDTVSSSATAAAPPEVIYYKVKEGDTLLRIAAAFGVPVDSLYKENNLKPDSVVFIGGRTRWWPTWEKKLAEFLKARGHVVLFVDAKEDRRTELLVSDRTSD